MPSVVAAPLVITVPSPCGNHTTLLGKYKIIACNGTKKFYMSDTLIVCGSSTPAKSGGVGTGALSTVVSCSKRALKKTYSAANSNRWLFRLLM